jgi:hypothetical protein
MTRSNAAKKQQTDAAAETIGQDRPRAQKSTGPARESLEPAHIEAVDRPVDKDWADQMKFNEEPVKIVVHDSTEKNAERVVEVWNNGISQRFIRGQEQVVKRKFMEVLARAKITSYTQEKVRDEDGNESYRNIPHTALRYPFSVIEDLNPRGREWLRTVLES